MLTASDVANAKPKAKPYKLTDERGMYLLVQPTGARLFRFNYRRPGTGKRNTLALYWKGPHVKIELGLARGKQQHDKRASEKERDWNREKQRVLRAKNPPA